MTTAQFAGLPLDVAQRLAFIADALDSNGVPSDALVLDVGGHPGLLAKYLPSRAIFTADTFAHGPARYVKASGGGLPFRDGTFAAVVCSDTLEHVPPRFRSGFLDEMVRVSSRIVVVSGPFDTRDVAETEKIALMLLPSMSPEAGWLREHADFGLPDLDSIGRQLASSGRVVVAGDGDLVAWVIAFSLRAAGERLHGLRNASEKVLRAVSALDSFGELSRTKEVGPFYRHGLIVDKQLDPDLIIGQACSDNEVMQESRNRRSELLHSILELIPALLESACKPGSLKNDEALRAVYVATMEKVISVEGQIPVSYADHLVVMGQNDLDSLTTGWHALGDGPAGIAARWTSGTAGIRVPRQLIGGKNRSIVVMISAPRMIDSQLVGLSLLDDDLVRIDHEPEAGTDGQWRMVKLDFAGALPAEVFLTLESIGAEHGYIATGTPVPAVQPLTWVADKIFSNGDYRTMGALVASVRFI